MFLIYLSAKAKSIKKISLINKVLNQSRLYAVFIVGLKF